MAWLIYTDPFPTSLTESTTHFRHLYTDPRTLLSHPSFLSSYFYSRPPIILFHLRLNSHQFIHYTTTHSFTIPLLKKCRLSSSATPNNRQPIPPLNQPPSSVYLSQPCQPRSTAEMAPPCRSFWTAVAIIRHSRTARIASLNPRWCVTTRSCERSISADYLP